MKKKRCQIVKITNQARVLKSLRAESNLSMQEAGFLIGRSDSYISHLENGRMDIPKGEQLEALLNLYNCSHDNFLEKVRLYKEVTPRIDILSNLIKKLDENKVNILIHLTQNLINNKGTTYGNYNV